jgi:hypothetical protein
VRAQRHIGLLLEPGDDVDDVTADDGSVRPVQRFLQRRRLAAPKPSRLEKTSKV